MKKKVLLCALTISVMGLSAQGVFAARPVDNDGDGYKSTSDCNDNDNTVWVLNTCGVCEVEPVGGCGGGTVDNDNDGYTSENDCDDNNNAVWVLNTCGVCAVEPVGGCGGGTNPHAGITGTFTTPAQVTAKCLTCHDGEGFQAMNSLHGMMPTLSPKVTNSPGLSQKLSEINTFCSYPNPAMAGAACLTCHPTLGKFENVTAADIDCLACHNDAYKRSWPGDPDPANHETVVDWQGTQKTYIPSDKDDATGEFYVNFNWAAMPGLTVSDLIQGVHRPTTTTCLSCHAKAGGGDWTKRGDIGLNSANPTSSQDVHLASVANGGAGLSCSDCHTPTNHQIPGRGIDLRPTEGGSVKTCVECHTGMDAGGHAAAGRRSEPDRHAARVACQSCHIPVFGKGGATEMTRNWTLPHWNQALCGGQGAWAGEEIKVANVAPDHVFFDGTSYIYKLGDVLRTTVDPISGSLMQADANGSINGILGISKLVPVKRHKSNMAVMSSGPDSGKVIPFDVVWQFKTGLADEAAERGKTYAGFSGSHEWKWLESEMAINHGVSPAASVAACTSCHHAGGNFLVTTQTKLDKIGYALKDADKNGVVNAADKAIICSQCHSEKAFKRDWEQMHAHTAKGSGIGCTFCHDIKRPERGLTEPCNPDGTENSAAISEFVDTNYYNHCAP